MEVKMQPKKKQKKIVEMRKEQTNQEAKGEICNDGKRDCNSRELQITNMSHKNIGEGINTIIAKYIKCNRPRDCP